jgi:DNA-binding SARP family transcriptional activator
MAHLSIQLLGPFEVRLEGEPATGFVSDKARALLAYLVVEEGRPHRREALAGLLWPDVPEDLARTSLRTALASVRQVIGDHAAAPPYLDVTRQTVQFNWDSDARVDVLGFTHLLEAALPQRAGEPEDPSSAEPLEEAIALYQGSFLEGFYLADSVLFEEWALLVREQLQRQALTALHRLAAYYETSGEPLRALQHAWRAVDLDPWPGSSQRQLMRLLALTRRREAALAQYKTYCQLLAEELGVEPSEPTRELYELLSEGEWPADVPVSGVILEREVVVAGPCPYRGLAAFQEEDAPFFFGRAEFAAAGRGREAQAHGGRDCRLLRLRQDINGLCRTGAPPAGGGGLAHRRLSPWSPAFPRPGGGAPATAGAGFRGDGPVPSEGPEGGCTTCGRTLAPAGRSASAGAKPWERTPAAGRGPV